MTIATYQAVSGTGKRAMEELRSQSLALLQDDNVQPSVYPHPIAFNALPQCDVFDGDETTEETKLVHETHKILGDDDDRHHRHLRAGAGVALALRGGVDRDRAASSRPTTPASCCEAPPA